MARRMEPSSSRSMASWAIEEETRKEIGLPLIVCLICKRKRVMELIVRTTDNGNQGRVFFKCSRNMPDMPGRCRFYEFHKIYSKKLVQLKYVIIDLEAGLAGEEEAGAGGIADGEEAHSQFAAKIEKNSMDKKLDALLSLLKMLIVVLLFSSLVGMMYVFK